ncbi:MAG TPA: amidohydrolase [Dongiaceae bacterium]|nr:amidohydrolase [Dongiaceae bacterium]
MDLILTGGVVWGGDAEGAPAARAATGATALAIRGGTIAAIGDDATIKATATRATRQIALGGALVLPGLMDAHGHVRGLGERLATVDVRGARRIEAVVESVRRRAATTPPGRWITGGGWDQNLWPGGAFPDHRPLDAAAPGIPVYLRRIDSHAAWASRAALAAAGIDRATPDPAGGRIERDAAGDPTGILIDNAMPLVERARPARTRDEIRAYVAQALERCAAAGLTAVHDAGVSIEEAEVFGALADEGSLPIRVYLMWDGTGPASIDAMLERAPFVGRGGRLTHRAVKLMVDGAMGSRGAVFFDDYADAPGVRGLFVTAPAEIERRAVQAMRRGYQVATHAIGDRGVHEVVGAYEKALAAVRPGAGVRFEPRLRIEHVQCARVEDLARARRLGVIASMQPSHATSDMGWAVDRVGAARAGMLYAWRTVAGAGLTIAGGSDFPIDPETPLLGLHAAVTRQDRTGRPAGGWHPEERLTIEEAVDAYTRGAAYAAFEEHEAGRVAPGFRADLTVLDEDLRRIPPERIHAVPVRGTIVGGQIVYDRF